MEKMLDRRTSLRIDVALYQRIHAICIEVGIPVGLFIRAAATNVDPGMLETGSKAWKTGIHSFTPVDRRETQGERRRIDLRLSDAEREIIARAAANRHTSRAHFIASQAEQLAGDPRVRDILNRLADLAQTNSSDTPEPCSKPSTPRNAGCRQAARLANAAAGLHG